MEKRELKRLPRGKDGLFIQPDDNSPKREVQENKHRMTFANHFNFADMFIGNTRTYDAEGRYNCGRCNQAQNTKCALVAIKKINLEAGSCAEWENQDASDSEVWLQELDIDAAGYGEAKNGIGFGCLRCPFASPAHEPDSRGRSLYCGKGDFRTFSTACCRLNGAPETKNDYDSLAMDDEYA